ncbi:MAG: hypothetical protein ACTHL8_16945 [Burkholderiaceae bacterium]
MTATASRRAALGRAAALALGIEIGLAGGLAGCGLLGRRVTPAAPGVPGIYPAPVADFGRWDRFPAEVAGYRRGAVVRYAPGLVDYSIAYDRMDAQVQDAVTLYFYPRMNDAAAQVAQEEAQVLQSHPGARVLDRRDLPLQRNGATYTARLVTFEFEEVFAGRLQRVSSQLLVAFRALGTFKARSTAPFAQAVQAQASFLRLLDGVAWDAPGEIGAQ